MKVFESDGIFTFSEGVKIHDELPVGVYLLSFSPSKGFFLIKKPDFVLPSKIYGDMSEIERWNFSYENNTTKNLGILMTGLKGTGKTLMAKKFCVLRNKPVILITTPFDGQGFIQFLSSPQLKDCTVFIDEFEKVYPNFDVQKQFLTVMDGVFETHMVFLLTSNAHDFNELFFNRLERIKYHKSFRNLQESIVREIARDMLVNPSYEEDIVDIVDSLQISSYDLVINIVKECNLFNQPPIEVVKYLNIRKAPIKYSVSLINNGVREYLNTRVFPSVKKGKHSFYIKNPAFNHEKYANDEDYNVPENITIEVCFEDCIRTEIDDDRFRLDNKNGVVLEFFNPMFFCKYTRE